MNKKKKIQKILVATDFSETSEYALSRAIELAKRTNAKITIIHVIKQKFVDKVFELFSKDILQTPKEYISTLMKNKEKQNEH